MNLLKQAKFFLIVGLFPLLSFILGVIIAYYFFPYDVDSAARTLIAFSGFGISIAILKVLLKTSDDLKGIK